MTYLKWINKDQTIGQRITYGETLKGLKENLTKDGSTILFEIEHESIG